MEFLRKLSNCAQREIQSRTVKGMNWRGKRADQTMHPMQWDEGGAWIPPH